MLRYIYLLLSFCLSGCYSYQYGSINSSLRFDSASKSFDEQKGAVKVSYRFDGQGCPIIITVNNEGINPAYINWELSSLHKDGENMSYGQEEKISMVPAGKSMQFNFSTLLQPNYVGMPSVRGKVETKEGTKRFKMQSFTKENSPLKFKSFLVIDNETSFTDPKIYEGDFWMGELVQTSWPPDYYGPNTPPKANFHNSKLSLGSEIAVFFVVVIATGIYVLINPI